LARFILAQYQWPLEAAFDNLWLFADELVDVSVKDAAEYALVSVSG
jgi:hypothetical protein